MKKFTKDHYIGTGAIVAKEKTICGEYPAHRHEFYEIEYILSGSGEYQINDQVFEIQSGMLFFMTPFHFHRVSTPECRVINVMFSEELCDTDVLVSLLHTKAVTPLNTNTDAPAFWRAILGEITAADKNSPYTAYLLNTVLGKLALSQSATPRVGTPIKSAMLYLLHHFRENPSLAETAAHVGYAPPYFSSLFKREVGIGFQEYLDRLRFDYAKNLLKHSKISVGRVCRECGFEDYPNFIRRFKKHFGISPLQMANTDVQKTLASSQNED